MFLKVSPMNGVMNFGKKGKLSPHYVGSYLILRRVGNFDYELEVPRSLSSIDLIFHVSMLKKYLGGPSLIVPLEGIGISDSWSYEEVQINIFYRQVC